MLSSFKTELIEKTQLADNIYIFIFKLRDSQKINFRSGQYVFFKIDNITRLYSIASEEQITNKIELIIKIHKNGIASKYFSNLKVGENVDIHGPAGFFHLNDNLKPKCLVAFGTGITPFRSILKTLANSCSGLKIKLFWGLKTAKDIYCLDDLNSFFKTIGNFEYNICLSREVDVSCLDNKIFKKGRVDNFIPKNSLDYEYYLCGQQEIVTSMNLFLLSMGVNSDNIFFEIY